MHEGIALRFRLLPHCLHLSQTDTPVLTPIFFNALLYKLVLIHFTAVYVIADVKVRATPHVADVLLAELHSRCLAHT